MRKNKFEGSTSGPQEKFDFNAKTNIGIDNDDKSAKSMEKQQEDNVGDQDAIKSVTVEDKKQTDISSEQKIEQTSNLRDYIIRRMEKIDKYDKFGLNIDIPNEELNTVIEKVLKENPGYPSLKKGRVGAGIITYIMMEYTGNKRIDNPYYSIILLKAAVELENKYGINVDKDKYIDPALKSMRAHLINTGPYGD